MKLLTKKLKDMKKFMFAAIAALAITSCSQNEEFEAPSQKSVIDFNTVVSKSTRATALNLDGLKTNGFKVYGYTTDAKMEATTILPAAAFMPAVEATWATDKWVLTPSGPYYWPIDGKIQFFAFSPVTDVTYTAPNGTAGYPTFSYTVKAVADQEDLVAAFAKDQTKTANSTNGVSLAFKHVLTQINFALKGKEAGFKYTVAKISLSGIANGGTFTYNDPVTSVGAWSNTSGTESYVYNATYTEIEGVAAASPEIKTTNNALMLMPQTLGDNAKITITYSTMYNGKKVFDGAKEVSLKDIIWNAGDNILYTLSLPGGATDVTFVPTVDSWNAEASGDKEPK